MGMIRIVYCHSSLWEGVEERQWLRIWSLGKHRSDSNSKAMVVAKPPVAKSLRQCIFPTMSKSSIRFSAPKWSKGCEWYWSRIDPPNPLGRCSPFADRSETFNEKQESRGGLIYFLQQVSDSAWLNSYARPKPLMSQNRTWGKLEQTLLASPENSAVCFFLMCNSIACAALPPDQGRAARLWGPDISRHFYRQHKK